MCSNNLIFIQPLHSIVDAMHVISIVTIVTTPLSQFITLKQQYKCTKPYTSMLTNNYYTAQSSRIEEPLHRPKPPQWIDKGHCQLPQVSAHSQRPLLPHEDDDRRRSGQRKDDPPSTDSPREGTYFSEDKRGHYGSDCEAVELLAEAEFWAQR